jgi:tripartite-type tricarboxylate transporter receptor subunit TctC
MFSTLRALLAAVLLSSASWALPADAPKYPSKTIHFIVPVPPGGGVDLLSRVIGTKMAQNMGVSVIIENRPGASAVIGTEALAKSPPDGYTIMMAYTAHATNPLLQKLPYDTDKDFTAVAFVGYIPLILVTHPSFPANSVKELIAMAKAKPGELQYASGGAGAGAHLSGELLKQMAGVNITHIPYKGNAPALNDVLGGQVPFMFDTLPTSMPHVKAGKLKALAVTTEKRTPLAPEIPTMIEEGLPGFVISAWYAVLAPAGTPKDVVAGLNAEINKAIKDPDIQKRMAAQGIELVGGTPEEAQKFIDSEVVRWRKVIKEKGITAEGR